VFRRLPPALARHAELTERQLGGAPWKALAARDRASHEREVITLRAAHEREVVTLRAVHAAEVTALTGKLARAESVIDYVTQRTLVEGIFFRPDGRPVKPLRRLLFHTSGKTRWLFRRVVLHKDGTPRQAFARWMQNQTCLAPATTPQAARLTSERDALSGR
jgi:hypothetical protein